MNKMSVELPLSTRILPITHPAMFTSMTMASLWFLTWAWNLVRWKLLVLWPTLTTLLDHLHGSEIVISLPLGFKLHGWASCSGHDSSERGQCFRVVSSWTRLWSWWIIGRWR
jgi:hypothetical protein